MRTRLEVGLVCPKCAAMNRPGATIIEVDDHAVAHCGCCAHAWLVKP